MELIEQMPLLEWFANNYKSFGKHKLDCTRKIIMFVI